jgi:hypothetical protein
VTVIRRSLIVLGLLALAGPAAAQPAGWLADREHAQVVERDLLINFPEGARANLQLESFRSPEPGAQLIRWTLEVAVNGDGGGFARARIDDLRTTVEAIAGGGGKVRTLHWSEKDDPKQRWVEALLEWIDDDTGVRSMTRAIWVHPKGVASIREHRVECVLGGGAPEALATACVEEIAKLAVTPLAEREPFVAAAAEAAPAAEPAEPGELGDSDSMRPTPKDVGPVLHRREPERQEERDLRPFYIGGFVLLLAGVLWWSRRRNAEAIARAERAEAKASGKPEEPSEPLADEEKEDARE